MSTTEPRTTLATVAASAGVSVATVSKVLNGRRDVAPATRARVQEMLRAHDYGGRLKTIERHPTIELTFRGKIGGYSSEIVQGVAATAAELGVAVTIGVKPVDQLPSAKIEAATWARNLAVNGRGAVIAVTDELGWTDRGLARLRLPLVVIDPMNIPSRDIVSVGSTNFRGGQAAARHLVELGHRRIAYLGGRATAECSQARLAGFRSALETAGISAAGGLRAQHRGLPLRGRPRGSTPAPVAPRATDSDLRGQRRARPWRHRGCPLAGSVGARATSASSGSTTPRSPASPRRRLTTVRQPLQEMGAVALRTALRLVAGEKIDSNHVELATELVVRKSTAAAP